MGMFFKLVMLLILRLLVLVLLEGEMFVVVAAEVAEMLGLAAVEEGDLHVSRSTKDGGLTADLRSWASGEHVNEFNGD